MLRNMVRNLTGAAGRPGAGLRCGLAAAAALAGLAVIIGPKIGAAPHAERQAGDTPVDDNSPAQPIPKLPNMVVLFSGKPEEMTDNWVTEGTDQPPRWTVENGTMTSKSASIVSKQKFHDFQLHVEWKEPYVPTKHGQGRGNSGVGLLGAYEIQVLDSYGIKEPGSGDCGSVYSQAGPLFNACKPPLSWQTYDITFRAPRLDAAGKKVENARVSVWQNGICVQNNQEILKATGIGGSRYKDDGQPGPIYLQYHENSVQFRSVWVVPLPDAGATHYEPR